MHSPRRYLYLLSYFIHPRAPKSVFSNQDFGLSFPDFAFEMKYSLTSQWHKHWFLLRDCTLIDYPVVSCSITVNYLIKQTLLLFGWSKSLSVNSLWIPQAGKRKLSLTERARLALVFWWNEKKNCLEVSSRDKQRDDWLQSNLGSSLRHNFYLAGKPPRTWVLAVLRLSVPSFD